MEFHPTPNSHDNRFNLIRSKCCWCCCYKLDVEVQFKCLEMMIKGRKILQIGSGTNLRAWACKMQTCHSCHSAATWTATTITTSSPPRHSTGQGTPQHNIAPTANRPLAILFYGAEDWLALFILDQLHPFLFTCFSSVPVATLRLWSLLDAKSRAGPL